MKLKGKYSKFLTSVFGCVIFCCLILSACSSDKENQTSVALVKNAAMSTYGTGFGVGVPGKATNTLITSYSVIATPNGVAPKTAEVKINSSEKIFSANVIYYDVGRNVALLKLSQASHELKPMMLKDNVDFNETVNVIGYDGTGNIMSDFEKFNTSDIVKYSGNISTYDELNTIKVYKYSNEFNRAAVGSPAFDKSENVIGMCAYSLNSMNTYSQYILSSDELIKILSSENIDFMTSDEVKYKKIIISSIIIGIILFVLIIILTLIIGNKNENNLKFKDKYIRITDGVLKGKVYKFDGKITIGRDAAKSDIVYPIDEPGISAQHCSIQVEGNECYLVDNFSKYGTYLENNIKISASTPYKIDKDKFVFYIARPQNRFEFIDKKEI